MIFFVPLRVTTVAEMADLRLFLLPPRQEEEVAVAVVLLLRQFQLRRVQQSQLLEQEVDTYEECWEVVR